MTTCQQRVYRTFALLEESDLKAFFRAIRHHADSTMEVEVVNMELDRGVQFMDIFGPLGPLAEHTEHHVLELEALLLPNGRWSIDFGFHGPKGVGGCWTMRITPDGRIKELVAERVWIPRRY